jgi:glyoxylase-like metal-dependent hydrolase (beta-lactamase superfamily II)
MKRVISLVTIVLLGLGSERATAQQTNGSSPSKPAQQLQRAVTALGGADNLQKLQSLTIKATAKHWEQEQSVVAGGPPRPLGTSQLTIIADRNSGSVWIERDHKMEYPFPGTEKYSEIITPSWGAVIDDKGERAMSANRLAFELREQERASPGLVAYALAHPQQVLPAPDQKLGGKTYPAVAFTDRGTKFIILFDRQSSMPVAVRTLEDDVIHGDGVFDLILADWKTVAGVKLATSLSWKFNGLAKLDLAYSEITPNAPIAPQAFTVSDATKQAAKPPASGDIPWQAMLVSMNFGRYNDLAEEQNAGQPVQAKLVELAPNVSQILGRSHNSLVVAMRHYLVVFDAPQNDEYSRAAIALMKAKYPGKPIRYLVMTHHHMDHFGGARTYVAEGATIIMGAPDKAHARAELSGAHKMHPDTLQQQPKPVHITEVKDKLVLKDGEEIDIFRVPNGHAEGMLTMYVAGSKIVWMTDIYVPTPQAAKNPENAAFHETIKKLGLSPALYAGGHGTSATEEAYEAMLNK